MTVPPLAQLAICMVIAGLFATHAPIRAFATPAWLIAAIVTTAVIFLLPAVMSFVRHKTTVNPQSPESASTLVTAGIYSVTRNPMYVGMLIILVAFALWLGAVSAFLTVVAFFLTIDRFQIRNEEVALAQRFGRLFEDYVARVPRWLFIRTKRGTAND